MHHYIYLKNDLESDVSKKSIPLELYYRDFAGSCYYVRQVLILIQSKYCLINNHSGNAYVDKMIPLYRQPQPNLPTATIFVSNSQRD